MHGVKLVVFMNILHGKMQNGASIVRDLLDLGSRA